ncbi:hypothetical protein M409DRAFT_30155 [Zasmidium cellare ATCC 36951]|uniref:Uncharacterized protein n=1 Tax=Zasmidium cellare ATCC 36951 TaxID=1080233 RepID=A0A6A6BXI7_ZASCE|nr:uncharacterized protein M409DRAFT_30155 [Zasmidium cellare ATCC 36951]KAF2159405.1 hypothetical protein M409DRAFT_30155 [Zasmidium cellare ATCC 36951]
MRFIALIAAYTTLVAYTAAVPISNPSPSGLALRDTVGDITDTANDVANDLANDVGNDIGNDVANDIANDILNGIADIDPDTDINLNQVNISPVINANFPLIICVTFNAEESDFSVNKHRETQ